MVFHVLSHSHTLFNATRVEAIAIRLEAIATREAWPCFGCRHFEAWEKDRLCCHARDSANPWAQSFLRVRHSGTRNKRYERMCDTNHPKASDFVLLNLSILES